jgi:hypothetical protein
VKRINNLLIIAWCMIPSASHTKEMLVVEPDYLPNSEVFYFPTLGEPRKSVYLLYCVSSVFCFRIFFILLLRGPFFLKTGIRVKGNSQEKRVLGSSGRNVGR